MSGEDWRFEYTVEQMRLQRHDFMNYLQVVYGYIQLNKPEEAIRYIKQINTRMTLLSMVFNLECPDLSVLLQDYINFCAKYGIDVKFNNELECISPEVISKNISEIKNSFLTIKEKTLNYYQREKTEFHIFLKGESDNFKIIFTISEDIGTLEGYKYSNDGNNINSHNRMITYEEDGFLISLHIK